MKEFYAIRLEPRMKRELELISRVLNVPTSEWIRNKLAYDVKETLETLRTQIALEYARGNITRKELERVFGKKMTKTIVFTLEKVKEDLKEAEKLAEKRK